MARRTVAQAEAWLEDFGPTLPGDVRRAVVEEINTARTHALSFANGIADDHAAEVDADRTQIMQTLCEVRDGYAQLIKDGQAGKLTAREFAAALQDLEASEASCESKIIKFSHNASVVADIEEGPLDYSDDHASRNPSRQYDFTTF